MSTLFIGMPVHNGARFIAEALDSLVRQSFADWALLVSDNHSTDNTQAICREYCSRDARIKYHRQPENVGPLNNFRFLLEQANSPYFMWAAADDVWDRSFLEVCINGLDLNPHIGLAFTNMVNIDSFGHIIREYPSFKPFSNPDPYLRIASYVLTPECMGKANLIYSVYRLDTPIMRYMLDTLSVLDANGYGVDMAFVLGILCRTRLYMDERVLFKKRYAHPEDRLDAPRKISPNFPFVDGIPRNEDFDAYKQSILTISRGTQFEDFIAFLMDYRSGLNFDVETFFRQTVNTLSVEGKQALVDSRYLLNRFRKLIDIFHFGL